MGFLREGRFGGLGWGSCVRFGRFFHGAEGGRAIPVARNGVRGC